MLAVCGSAYNIARCTYYKLELDSYNSVSGEEPVLANTDCSIDIHMLWHEAI